MAIWESLGVIFIGEMYLADWAALRAHLSLVAVNSEWAESAGLCISLLAHSACQVQVDNRWRFGLN